MKKNLFIISILLILFIILIFNSNIIIESCLNSIEIFKNNLFPSLFPFFILSDLLINYGLADIISELFKNLFIKIFKTDKICSYIFIISLISGYSSSNKTIKELYDKGNIDPKMINKIILFTHFVNPLYIISTLSIYLNSFKLSLLILFIHYISNIIIGLIFRNYNKTNQKPNKIRITLIKSDNLINILTSSIKKSINTLLLILGTITTISILSNIICNLTDNYLLKSIIKGLFDFTNGINNIDTLNISIKFKALLSISFLSFGGISCHLQNFSILSDINIKYLPYLLARLLHTLISFILLFIMLQLH